MPTPGALVSCVASALNVPIARVRHLDRLLAEAGLRSKLKSGGGAAETTPRDAALLSIALCCDGTARDAVTFTRSFQTLRCVGLPDGSASPEVRFALNGLDRQPFAEAFARTIAYCASSSRGEREASVMLSWRGAERMATISIISEGGRQTPPIFYEPARLPTPERGVERKCVFTITTVAELSRPFRRVRAVA